MANKYFLLVTCLSPVGQLDVGILREVWDSVRDYKAALIESGKRKSSRRRWVCPSLCSVSQQTLADSFIDTEAVHRPARQRDSPESQIGHQTLERKTKQNNKSSKLSQIPY